MNLLEAALFALFALSLFHGFLSRGGWWVARFFIPITCLALFVDNVVVATGHLRYLPSFSLWACGVPLCIGVGWGALLYIVYWFAEHPKIPLNNDGKGLVVLSLLLSLTDFFVESCVPTSLFGWEWVGVGGEAKVPLRNLLGWFLISSSYLLVFARVEALEASPRKKMAILLTCSIALSILIIAVLKIVRVVTGID